MLEIKEGARFARFKLVRKKGEGSTAEVWEAIDDMGRSKALKIFTPRALLDDYSKRLIRAEFENSKVVNHPNLILPDEYLEEEGVPALAMQLCDSSLWQEYLRIMALRGSMGESRKSGCFSELFIVKLLNDIGSALDTLHREFVHNDIKPANILINNGENDQQVEFYLSDFGITREMRDTLLRYTSNYNSLTIAYAAPEKLRGERESLKSDIFSLGASLYEMMYGPNHQVPLGQILNNNGQIKYEQTDYSMVLVDLLRAMLASDPELRPSVQNIKELTAYYLRFGSWPRVIPSPPPPNPPVETPPKPPTLKYYLRTAVVLIALIIGYLGYRGATQFNYDASIRIDTDLFLVEKKGKVGLVDSKGQIIRPLEYNSGKWEEDRIVLYKGEEMEEVLISY